MKKHTTILLVLLILIIGLCIGEFNTHVCVDNTHMTCDGECGCDGLNCDQ